MKRLLLPNSSFNYKSVFFILPNIPLNISSKKGLVLMSILNNTNPWVKFLQSCIVKFSSILLHQCESCMNHCTWRLVRVAYFMTIPRDMCVLFLQFEDKLIKKKISCGHKFEAISQNFDCFKSKNIKLEIWIISS
jgi:hypothetical protein